MKETLSSIAERTGYSITTVSRALSGQAEKYRISEKARKEIAEEARRCNYSPNIIARNLRTNKNTTIGVVIPELNHHFFASVLDGIEQTANEAGYNILICQSGETKEKEEQLAVYKMVEENGQ